MTYIEKYKEHITKKYGIKYWEREEERRKLKLGKCGACGKMDLVRYERCFGCTFL